MQYIQESFDISTGKNCRLSSIRYSLPAKSGVSVIVLSDSYEYDMELIRKIPQITSAYKNLLIPFKRTMKAVSKSFDYNLSKEMLSEKIKYLKESKINMNVKISKDGSMNNMNFIIPTSDIYREFKSYFNSLDNGFKRDNICKIFNGFMNSCAISNNKTEKIILIDTKRFQITKQTYEKYDTDLINAFLSGVIFNNHLSDVETWNTKIIFRTPNGDYLFDIDKYNEKTDKSIMQLMLNKIHSNIVQEAYENETSEEAIGDETNKDINKEDINLQKDDNISNYQFNSKNVISSIKTTIQHIKDNNASLLQSTPNKIETVDKLYQAKILKINTDLISRISSKRSDNVINSYKTIANDLKSIGDNPVENRIIDAAAQTASNILKPVDTNNIMHAISSARELKIRSIIGKIKLDDSNIETLMSVTDVPFDAPVTPAGNVTTTNKGVSQGSAFPFVAREYEEKLMDKDIIAAFSHLGDLPYGFVVKDIEVSDISTITTLMNNWKVTLDNKKSGRRSVLNIKVPKVINGKFYNNGIWYVIGKQDFPMPIVKVNKKTVMFTSNYGKMTIERYDTKSLVDIMALLKVIKKADMPDGTNKYIKPGSSITTNSRYESTVEFDEYAKQWISFSNKEANCEILFNRQLCDNAYTFVTVNENEFCCGMINKVPVVLNTETGLTRNGKTITDVMLDTLPQDYRDAYYATKPGKVNMIAQLRVLATNMPLGVVCSAWEGITNVLKKSGSAYKIAEKNFKESGYLRIQFKDCVLAIENNITNQLIFNGFYKINTKAHQFSEFDTPITEDNSIYVDIFNDLFFKKYSDLTAFITTYHFFLDSITNEVCLHYNIPNDIVSGLIYCAKLLVDNNHMNENNTSLYRIRSSEIIPAMIHYHLALAISKYNNTTGSKTRTNTLQINPNEVVNSLLEVNTVNPISALNPMIELHAGETSSLKGFMGLNVDRSYTKERRSMNDTMVGKYALSSPNSANVGVNRQLTIDPKIDSIRGYTSNKTIDDNYTDLQLASFSELLTPGSVSRDDAIRTAIATSQTGHIVSTAESDPVLIGNGVDEIVPAYLSEEFSYIAKQDGTVLEINDDYMIIQYKDKTKEAVNVGSKYSFNSGSGFYVDNKLLTNKKEGESFKQNEIIAYHEKFFTKDSDGIVRMNLGPLVKVAIAGSYFTYEDAGMMTAKVSKKLGTKLTMCETIKIDALDDVEKIVSVGDEIEIGDPLVIFGLGDTGDKSVDTFLKAFQTDAIETAKRQLYAKHSGTVVDVRIYTNKSLDKLSPSLYNIISKHFKDNKKKRAVLDKHDASSSPYKLNTLYGRPTEPLTGNSIKGITCDVLVEIYIEHSDDVSIGDKVAMYGPSKQIISDMIPEGLEPYTEFRPNEEVSMFVPPVTILKRMVPSIVLTMLGNKVLIETKRKMKEIWESDKK